MISFAAANAYIFLTLNVKIIAFIFGTAFGLKKKHNGRWIFIKKFCQIPTKIPVRYNIGHAKCNPFCGKNVLIKRYDCQPFKLPAVTVTKQPPIICIDPAIMINWSFAGKFLNKQLPRSFSSNFLWVSHPILSRNLCHFQITLNQQSIIEDRQWTTPICTQAVLKNQGKEIISVANFVLEQMI